MGSFLVSLESIMRRFLSADHVRGCLGESVVKVGVPKEEKLGSQRGVRHAR